MLDSYRRTRKSGSVGVDGQTAQEYEQDLEANLRHLLEELKSGSYKAPPVRRHYIPKADGSQRPLGVPTFEDKVAQRAVTTLLEEVYEQEFLNVSFGYRRGQSAHGALRQVRGQVMDHRTSWILDIDISKFFDSIDHGELRKVLDLRVRDGVIRRLIDKWLKAGVLEGGQLYRPVSGTPQGGVISPLLANILLHHILDLWFTQEVKPRLKGHGFMVRFCDDFVMGFENRRDAHRVWQVLPKRLGRFGLKLHETKSRVVDFRSPPNRVTRQTLRDFERCCRQLQTFDFLGFTHHWHTSRNGYWVVYQKTMRSRFTRAVRGVKEWCRNNRHQRLPCQQKWLSQMLRGHYGYYGITGNARSVRNFYRVTTMIWRKWLSRRSRVSYVSWEKFQDVLHGHPLPTPKVIHQYQAAKL